MLALDVQGGNTPPNFFGRQVNAWSDETGRICTRLFVDGRQRWVDWPGLGVFGFETGAASVQFWPSQGSKSEVVADTFARVLQPAILQALGWQTLHASAVVAPTGAFAFCGVKQSGKSTIAYALRRAGCRQLADDALVLELTGDRVLASALPFSPRLRADAGRYFDEHASPHEGDRDGVDRTVLLPLTACFVLRRDPLCVEGVHIVRVAPAQAFSELLTHAHCFDCADSLETRRIVEDYLAIANRIAVYRLTYRPGLELLPRLVDAILSLNVTSDNRASTLQ